MKKFLFKFATVLEVRKSREREALVALGGAQRAYQQAQNEKLELQNTLHDSLVRRENLGQDATPILSFHLEQNYIVGTKQRIIKADQAIVRASRGVEKALRAYLLARKQTRMIEVLEDKARAEFRAESNRHERKQQDELATMRARLRLEESA
jgi:flagellar export protein FliJ